MKDTPHHFDEVSLLVTHYNRSASLERLLSTFRNLGIGFNEIVVSDDGSRPEHQEKLKTLQETFGFRLVGTPVNKGLGNNINKGQDAVSSPYTLYIQEDFVPKAGFAEHFADALGFMKADTSLDIIRFYAYFPYPYMEPFEKGFSKMLFKAAPWYNNHLKFYYYSDHPHLRRTTFLEKFGRYPEGIRGDETEFGMALSVLKHKGKGLFYNDYTGIIDQANSSSEPSTMVRSNWRQKQNLITLLLRKLYLQYRFVKNSIQLLMMR